jgi:hypothetical protein
MNNPLTVAKIEDCIAGLMAQRDNKGNPITYPKVQRVVTSPKGAEAYEKSNPPEDADVWHAANWLHSHGYHFELM